MTACVIDASAILAYAFAEKGAARVERWIDDEASVSALTVQETVSKLCQTGMALGEAEELIRSLGLAVHPLDLDLAVRAGLSGLGVVMEWRNQEAVGREACRCG